MVSLHDRRIFPGARLEKIVVPRFNLSNLLDQLIPEAGALYGMNHGYIEFATPHRRHPPGSFFVTREKKNAGHAAPLFACPWIHPRACASIGCSCCRGPVCKDYLQPLRNPTDFEPQPVGENPAGHAAFSICRDAGWPSSRQPADVVRMRLGLAWRFISEVGRLDTVRHLTPRSAPAISGAPIALINTQK